MEKIEKALERIKQHQDELGEVVGTYITSDGLLCIEFKNGWNFSLSNEEINHQSSEYDYEGMETNPTDFYHNMVNDTDYDDKLIECFANNHLDTSKEYEECLYDFIAWVDAKNLKLEIAVEYWSPKNETVVTESGYRYLNTDSVKQKEIILSGTKEDIFNEFNKLNNRLRYCNGSYYKFKDNSLDNEYNIWFNSLKESTKFNMYYGDGVVD